MKSFIPDVKNNVCTVDANGITKLMKCDSVEECFYYCDKLNKVESNDKLVNSSDKPTTTRH